MKTSTLVLASLTLLASVAAGQQSDSPVVVYHPNSQQAQYLQAHADAAPAIHAQGQLNFRHTDGKRTAIFGPFTHLDSTGNWVVNDPVLSSTGNGWRMDGTANAIVISQSGANHVISQTFTDSATKHNSVLNMTVPALSYDGNFQFHFVQNGLTWTVFLDPSGTFSFQSDVATRRGSASYSFPLSSSEALAATAAGGLSGNAHVSLSRAAMVPKTGQTMLCSPWTFTKGQASFTCDDSQFKDSQLPYRIDPASQTITDGGGYNISSSGDTNGDCGDGSYNCYEESDNPASVTVNTSGMLPGNATILSTTCSFTVNSSSLTSRYIDDNVGTVSDTISCSNSTFNLYGTTSVTVQINPNVEGAWNGEFGNHTGYSDSANVNQIGMTVDFVAPPQLPSGLFISGYANSWFNVSFTVSDSAGNQNLGATNIASQYMILNTGVTYNGGCNTFVHMWGGVFFDQLDNSGTRIGNVHQFGGGSYASNTSVCAIQNAGSAVSFNGCSSGCPGSVTYTFPVYFYAGGTRSIYLYATNGDYQSTGWVNAGTLNVIPSTTATPAISPGGGTYSSYQAISLSTSTPGATIRYTLDGSTPTETSGTLYTGAFTLTSSATVRVIAYEAGWYDSAVAGATYTLQPSAPAFSPGAGTYISGQSVTLSTSAPAGTIYYTTNGATPACGSGSVYSGAIAITGTPNITTTTTVKAIACQSGWTTSSVSSASYTITGATAAPTFSPGAGTYTSATSITLSTATSGATIRYTTDGSTPTETYGTLYIGPIPLPLNSTTTIRAIAYESAWLDSSISSGTFVITGTVAPPSFTPGGGTYTATQTVAITTSTSGASIRYTTDGSAPTETHGAAYGGPVTISATTTLKALAYKSAWLDSSVTSAAYYFTNPTGGTGSGGSGTGTPPADSGNGMDPRRIGVRTLGSYWGGAGEQIDTTSGNLNFTQPLLKVLGRGGWSVGVSLSYNSQMWRSDSGGSWLLGYDVGYGLGWRLQLCSLIPIYGTSGIDHYLFTDSTGAEYSLNVSSGHLWTSQEGIYLTYNDSTNTIYQPDGSFWVMGSQSSGGEQDAGTLYPVQAEDSNGNQIAFRYAPGAGSGGTYNTSARIISITDPRTFLSSPTYTFTYNNDPIPHLTSIAGEPGESYSFAYATNSNLQSLIDHSQYGPTVVLQGIVPTFLCPYCSQTPQYTFAYDTSGEMTSMTTPLGGSLNWSYNWFQYANNVKLNEVVARGMSAPFTNIWNFSHDATSTPPYHATTTLSDNGAHTQKVYTASAPLTNFVLPATYEEWNADSSVNLHKDFTYSQSNGNTYMNSVTTTLGPSGSSVKSMSVQTLDSYGNLTQQQAYDYGNLTTAARTYTLSYVNDSNHTSLYIRNRLSEASVTVNGVTTPIVNIYYDQSNAGFTLQDPSIGTSLPMHDSNYGTSWIYRGNPTSVAQFGNISHPSYTGYQITGMPYISMDPLGNTVAITPATGSNYSLPGVLTPNGNSNLATSVTYASSFAVTSVTGANNATASTTYDNFGRPQNSTSVDGAVTNYTYSYNPNLQTATLGTQWKYTYLDGFGRTTSVISGHDSTSVNEVDTQYAPCACSPLGKLSQVSLPYASGGTAVWTKYTYDGSGRTLTITKPDNSVTTYSYPTSVTDPTGINWQGNFTKTIDPAGHWKIQQSDSFGNLLMVLEPNPVNPSTSSWLVTTYTYDVFNHLLSVTMPRSNGTQVRTFQYTGSDLTSTTNPENGTVTYQYDAGHHVTLRTDAKGQQTQYTYDAYGRLTLVQHYLPGNGGYPQEQANQDVNYYYDTNPFDSNFSQNSWGRLTATTFGGLITYYGSIGYGGDETDYYMSVNPSYMYSYNVAGRVTGQRLQTNTSLTGTSNTINNFDNAYAWDNQGRMTSRTGPDGAFTYTYDSMGRLSTLAENSSTVATAQYNPAGQISSLTYDAFTETRSYNSLMQLTGLTTMTGASTVMNMTYTYTAGQNNGRITQSTDGIMGETVNYTYDALNRLATAGATNGSWGQQYTYDGFGNLTGTQGAAVWSFDPNTNRPAGGSYDANGLPTGPGMLGWDIENRLTSTSVVNYYHPTTMYAYDPSGKRVIEVTGLNGGTGTSVAVAVYTYSLSGQRLLTIQCTANINNGTAPNCALQTSNLYFGSKLIRSNGLTVATDRLGSVRGNSNGERMAYWPYGQERTSTPDGREKFGTYFRDGPGQDYADQRYYNTNTGAFFSPDPSGASAADPGNPNSWNMYAYAGGDPINFNDPDGLATSNCGDSWFSYNGSVIGTVSQALNLTANVTILAETEFTEAGHGSSTNSTAEEDMIGEVIMNRWALVNGYWYLYPTAGRPPLDVSAWGSPGGGIDSVTQNGQFAVWNGSSLTTSAQNNLNGALSSAFDSKLCNDLAWAIGSAISFISSSTVNLYYDKATGLAPLAFNSANLTIPSYMGKIGSFGDANTFYGAPIGDFSANLIPLPRPRPIRPPRPPRKPGPPRGGPRMVQ